MKTKITFISITLSLLLGLNNYSIAQNLVPNPGFETQTSCPLVSEITKALPWNSPTLGTPDLFNDTCSTQNFPGRTGHGSSGVFTYSTFSNNREYIQAPLTNALISGHTYCVSFWVWRTNYRYATNRIGAYFSTGAIHLTSTSNLPYTPVVQNPAGNMLSGSNWYQVSGSFTAAGGEDQIIIGNFSNDANTDTLVVNSGSSSKVAFYFIDDISVTACSVGIEENASDVNSIYVYPNPASDNLNILIPQSIHVESIKLFSLDGRELKITTSDNQNSEGINLNLTNYPSGIYYLSIQTKEGFLNKKVIIAR